MLAEYLSRRLDGKKKDRTGWPGLFLGSLGLILARREIIRGILDGGGGSSTVIVTSLLLRRTPSFTVFSSRLPPSFSRRSPSERMRSPPSVVITSPLFSPAFSAGEPVFTARTRTPSPSGAPKYVPNCPLKSSASIPRRGRAPASTPPLPQSMPGRSGTSGISPLGSWKEKARGAVLNHILP